MHINELITCVKFNPAILPLYLYSKTSKMTNFGTGHLKNPHFQVTIKTIICEVLHGHLHHLQGMRTLNANRHLARFVTF